LRVVGALLGLADRREVRAGVSRHRSAQHSRSDDIGEARDPAPVMRGARTGDGRPAAARRGPAAIVLCAALAAGSLPAARAAAADRSMPAAAAGRSDAAFVRLGEEFIDHVLRTRPQLATRLGVHLWDDQLRPVTQASIAEDAEWFHRFRARLTAIPRAALSFDRALEYDLLGARVDRELLDLEVIRPFAHNPNAYLDLVAGSIQSLLERGFAPSCRRMSAVVGRLRQVPEVLRAAQINLRNPPRIATEVAIGQFEGALRLYR